MQLNCSPEEARQRAATIRLLVMDVDGVLTGGELLYDSEGRELKRFNILDGLGIKLLQQQGMTTAIISGRRSAMLTRRAGELGIPHLVQGREDKLDALQSLLTTEGFTLQETAYIGDDLPDLAAIRAVGFGVTVPNAYPLLKEHARAVTEAAGGQGAVRELSDFLLQAQDTYSSIMASYL